MCLWKRLEPWAGGCTGRAGFTPDQRVPGPSTRQAAVPFPLRVTERGWSGQARATSEAVWGQLGGGPGDQASNWSGDTGPREGMSPAQEGQAGVPLCSPHRQA